MAFRKTLQNQPIKVILRIDDALDPEAVEDFEECYDGYLKDLNEERLPIVGKPTYFVLRRQLAWKTSKDIRNEQMKMGKKGRVEIDAAAYMEEVRFLLVDIENPDNAIDPLLFKADPADPRKADLKTVMEFIPEQAVMDLYNARNNQMKQGAITDSTKKKSKPSLNSVTRPQGSSKSTTASSV